MNIGDKFYLSYCPNIMFKLVSTGLPKDKTYTFEMITEGYRNKKFTRKTSDLDLKDWVKFE
jgi:hypothetical protein